MKTGFLIFLFSVVTSHSFAQTCEQFITNTLTTTSAQCHAAGACGSSPGQTIGDAQFYTWGGKDYNGSPVLMYECRQYACATGELVSLSPGGWFNPCSNGHAIALQKTKMVRWPTCQKGSIVQVENQILGESVNLVGTSFSLNYFSNWVEGKSGDYKLTIPIAGSAPRDDISSFDVEVKLGSTVLHTQSYVNNQPNVTFAYTWDGTVSSTPTLGSASLAITVTEYRPGITVPIVTTLPLGGIKARLLGLGGWLPSIIKVYDNNTKKMYSGDGSVAVVQTTPWGSGYRVFERNGKEVYYFDSSGRHVYTKTSLTGATIYTFNYDGNGKLDTIVEPFGRTTTFHKNLSGDLASIESPKGDVTSIALTVDGYISSITNPNSEVYSMTYYGTKGLLNTFTKPGTQTSTFTYDSDGNLTKDEHSGGYFFNLVNNSTGGSNISYSQTSRMSRTTTYQGTASDSGVSRTTYLPDGRSEVQYYTENPYSASGYDSDRGAYNYYNYTPDTQFNSLAMRVSSLGYQYGSANYTIYHGKTVSLSDVNDPSSVTALTYTATKGSFVNTTTYNPSTKVFSSATNLGRTSEAQIDSYERIISSKVGNLYPLELTYTNENITKIKQNSRETLLSYNSTTGRLDSMTNPLSQTTTFSYDSTGRLTYKVMPDLRSISYAYDSNGNISGITPPGRTIHTFTINSNELPGSYEPPSLSGVTNVNTTYQYNNDKQLSQITKPNGDTVVYNYNSSSGALQTVVVPAGTITVYPHWTNGLPATIATPNGFYTGISYAGPMPVQFNVYDGSYSFNIGYSANLSSNGTLGNDVVSSAGHTSSTINYTYDNDELLTGAGDLAITKDTPNGMLTATSIGTSPNIVTDSYTYNSFGEVTGYQAKYGTTVIYDLTLGRDGMGRINSKTQTMNSTTDAYAYTFDTTGRLTQVDKNSTTVATYGYDDNSNRNSGTIGAQTTTATYDAQDRMTAYNLLTFTYNANGDLTSKTNTLTSTTTSYTYDVFGNLTSVTLPSTDVITYEIDGLNRRIGKRINGTLQARWVYMDQTRIAAELDASGNIAKRFVYASKGNIPDYMIMGGDNYRIISDQLGSPRLVVKVSDGSIAERMDHDEYGRVIADTNPGLLPFGFAGGLYDTDTGLVRFGARDYDSEMGRWTSKDPILFGGGDTNLFGYTFQDPVNFIDPSGLKSDLDFVPPGTAQSIGVSKMPNMSGAYTVSSHGDPNRLLTRYGNLSANQLANLIKMDPSYRAGQQVVLAACEAGKSSSGLAQQLSNMLNAPVYAADGDVYVWDDGSTNVRGPGHWINFIPRPVPFK